MFKHLATYFLVLISVPPGNDNKNDDDDDDDDGGCDEVNIFPSTNPSIEVLSSIRPENHPLETVPLENSSEIASFYEDNLEEEDVLCQMAEEYTNSAISLVLPTQLELNEINAAITELGARVERLYALTKQQTIEIHNFNFLNLNSSANNTVKDKIHALFFYADIPLTWVISFTWTEKPNTHEIDKVTITLLNCHVKAKVVQKLKKYLEKSYNNIVYI
jgi:hypothetical protein